METVSIISFCVAFLVVLECAVRKSDFFSPARLYLFFHSVALGVSFLVFDKAMTPFLPFTSLVYFGSSACFLLGVGSMGMLWSLKTKKVFRKLDPEQYNWKVHFLFTFALFAFFLAGMICARLGSGLFPLLVKNKAKGITAFFSVNFLVGIAFSYGGLVAALFFMSLFRRTRRPKVLTLAFWMMLLTLGLYSLALSRSGMVFFAFFTVAFYDLAIRRLSVAKLTFFSLAFVSFVLVTGYLKSHEFAEQHKVKAEKVVQVALKIPYMYFANNFWNLDYALNPPNYVERHPTTYGFVAVSGLLDFIYLPGGYVARDVRASAGFDDQYNKMIVKVKGFNTVSYQWSIYRDFGVMGVFAVPFFIGMLLALLYKRAERMPTMLNTAVYSHLVYFIALSMFGYFPEASEYVYGLFYVCACCYFSGKFAPSSVFGVNGNGEGSAVFRLKER